MPFFLTGCLVRRGLPSPVYGFSQLPARPLLRINGIGHHDAEKVSHAFQPSGRFSAENS
jgi:hypothetical protein